MKSVALLRYRGQALLAALLLLLLLLSAIPPATPLDNGLGLVPPLAYSTWNYFNDAVNDTLVRALADSLVSTGLAAAGFRTLNIDAGYLSGRDASGRLIVDSRRYPSGIRNLSDTLHAMGLLFGVYTDLSGHTCGDGPDTGSLGHYKADAAMFAHEWQVDYLKVDFCTLVRKKMNHVPTDPCQGARTHLRALHRDAHAHVHARMHMPDAKKEAMRFELGCSQAAGATGPKACRR